jgi:hypothetical protein
MAKMAGQIPNGQELNLYSWLRQVLSMTNVLALCGPKNIFATNPKLVDTFWEFEADLIVLVANFLPNVIASKGYAAREKINRALIEYAERGDYDEASKVIQARFAINISKGFSVRQAAQSELGPIFGILVNTLQLPFSCLRGY